MHTLTRNILIAALAVVLGSYALYLITQPTFGKVTTETAGQAGGLYRSYDFFASTTAQTNYATTTSATSTAITAWFDSEGRRVDGSFSIEGAKRVNFYFSRDAGTGPNAGSSVFKVQVTRDGSTWLDYNRLRQATTTGTANSYFNLVSSHTITAATSTDTYIMETLGFKAVRCIVDETTDGSHKCAVSADF